MEPLTSRERDLLADVSEGLTDKEIAQRRHLSLQTVKNHLLAIRNKLGVRNRVELALHGLSGELERLRRWRERELSRRAEYERAQRGRIETNRNLRQQVNHLQRENDLLRRGP